MTGEEMKAIRQKLGLSVIELGLALGYSGNDNTINVTVRRYEGGSREIPEHVARLLLMFKRHGVPPAFLPKSD